MGASEADRGKRGRWGQARLVGAGETGGGRRGWWGEARPMVAVSRRAKSIVNKSVHFKYLLLQMYMSQTPRVRDCSFRLNTLLFILDLETCTYTVITP